jgi:hypothetical protein
MQDASTDYSKVERLAAEVQVSRDPRALWPDVSWESLGAELVEIARVSRQVLSGRMTTLGPRAAAAVPRAFGVAAFVSGMGPMLGYWIANGLLDAGPLERTLLTRHHEHGRRRHALLEERLVALLGALRAQAVVPIVLKGMDTARRYLPAPGTRTIGDIDILVRPAEHDRVRAVLRSRGLIEKKGSGQPSRSEWFQPETRRIHSLELDHAENPWAVDLHVTLDRCYHRGVVASLGERAFDSVPWELAGHPVKALGQPTLTAWLAIHAGYGLEQLQLARLVELIFVIRKDTRGGILRWDDLAALLAETGTARFAYPALALAEHLAPGTIPAQVIDRAAEAATSRARRVVAAIAASGSYRLLRRSLDDRLMWARGPRQLLLLASEIAWPAGLTGLAAVRRLYARRIRAVVKRQVTLRADSSAR